MYNKALIDMLLEVSADEQSKPSIAKDLRPAVAHLEQELGFSVVVKSEADQFSSPELTLKGRILLTLLGKR